MHDSSPFNQRSLGQHNSWVSRSLGARENPCFSAQIRPERTIGVWSPLGSSPCGCPCNPWSKAKNSSLPRPAARSDNLSHIGRSGHTAEVCHFGPHIVPHSHNLKQWGLATQLFASENDDLLPKDGSPNGTAIDEGWYNDLPSVIGLRTYKEMPWRTNA